MEKEIDFIQKHKKVKVSLQITKIARHISNFDFDEEYEEF